MARRFQFRMKLAMLVTLVVAGACAAIPFSLLGSGNGTNPTVLALCDANPAQLCVVGFDAQPPDQMAIVLFMPPASLRPVYVMTRYQGSSTRLECSVATDLASAFFCVGAQVPLGSAINIEVYARQGSVLLARGNFVVSAFALPTLGMAAAFTSTPTANPSLTTGTPKTTSVAGGTPATPTRTPLKPTAKPPGTAYPNP